MHEPIVTISGNVVADPDERVSASGRPFTVFRIATNITRRLADGSFEDLRTEYFRVSTFGNLATNVAASISKGQRVLVHGKLRAQTYVRPDGSEGASIEITASMVGHDLTFGWADFHKGRAAREDPNDPQNAEVVRQARAQDCGSDDARGWGSSDSQDWNPSYVEANGSSGLFGATLAAAAGAQAQPDTAGDAAGTAGPAGEAIDPHAPEAGDDLDDADDLADSTPAEPESALV